jgi:hypothetical protein
MGFLQVIFFPLPVVSQPSAPHSLIIQWSALYSLDIDRVIT